MNSPELLGTVDGALLVRGIDTGASDGRIHEHARAWLIAAYAKTKRFCSAHPDCRRPGRSER
jgi:hypothetical protein